MIIQLWTHSHLQWNQLLRLEQGVWSSFLPQVAPSPCEAFTLHQASSNSFTAINPSVSAWEKKSVTFTSCNEVLLRVFHIFPTAPHQPWTVLNMYCKLHVNTLLAKTCSEVTGSFFFFNIPCSVRLQIVSCAPTDLTCTSCTTYSIIYRCKSSVSAIFFAFTRLDARLSSTSQICRLRSS